MYNAFPADAIKFNIIMIDSVQYPFEPLIDQSWIRQIF